MVSQGHWSNALSRNHAQAGGRRWAVGFAVFMLLLTSLPYLLGYLSQGQDWRFTGFVFAVEDGNSYIAKMHSGAAGAWLFRTPYTAQEQGGVVAFLPYILLGKLASSPAPHELLVFLFQTFRLAASLAVILATYDFIAYFIPVERYRRYGLVLAVLGGGLGWVLLLFGRDTWLGSMPLEFYSPETFGFLQIYGLPHLALARAAVLWGLLVYLKSTRDSGSGSTKDAASLGLLWLLAAVCQPLTALCMAAVIGLHLTALAIIRFRRRYSEQTDGWSAWRRRVVFAAKAFLLPAPFLVYNALAFSLDPYLRAWTDQNLILSPAFPHYILAYGVLLPFVPFGARNLLRLKPIGGWLLVAWIMASPLLAYAPVNLQRRLLEGVWIALVVVALWSLKGENQPGVRWRVFFYTTFLAFPSTLVLLAGSIAASLQPGLPMYRVSDEVRAFEQLARQAEPGAVVMASYETGNALPAWAPLRVVIGHGPESADLEQLRTEVQHFYDAGTTARERQTLLEELDVQYVLYGPQERFLGDWDPAQSPWLFEIVRQGSFAVYEVSD